LIFIGKIYSARQWNLKKADNKIFINIAVITNGNKFQKIDYYIKKVITR